MYADDSSSNKQLTFTVTSNEGPLITGTWSCSKSCQDSLFRYYFYLDLRQYTVTCKNPGALSYVSETITQFNGSRTNGTLLGIVLDAQRVTVLNQSAVFGTCKTTIGKCAHLNVCHSKKLAGFFVKHFAIRCNFGTPMISIT